MHPLNLDDAAERYRCRDNRDGIRWQLMARHPPAHTAMTAQGTRNRWANAWSWIEVEDYPVPGEIGAAAVGAELPEGGVIRACSALPG